MAAEDPNSIALIRAKCQASGQEHLLQFHDAIDPKKQVALRADLAQIDFKECRESFERAMSQDAEPSASGQTPLDERMDPIEDNLYFSMGSTAPEELAQLEQLALSEMAQGTVGVICLAGGQGTRLGSPHPKGMFDIGLPSGKTLYQIQVERLLRLGELSGSPDRIPMYIMTSEHTKEPTAQFFRENQHFGMKAENIVLFEQRMIPCHDLQGQIILSSPYKVARAPDGNGGLYWALKHEGILDDMSRRGVRYIHVYCVDNVLVKMADPVFLGKCIQSQVETANKVVEKSFPSEAVGVVARIDGHIQVVEYSEIKKGTSEMRTPEGKLVFRAGNICNHFFTTTFLSRICTDEFLSKLPLHLARKKIPYVNPDDMSTVQCSVPNGVKLEKFVFDVFQFSNSFLVWECRREEEFSPLKNADALGQKDTPTTAREAVFSLHRKFVERAGGSIVSTPEGENNTIVCEISPRTSYGGEGLAPRVDGRKLEPPVTL
eukprot:snap_masked-scaffold372_size192401-processed-gene-0.5 protein:Tk00568 transcript:snap_masked-scaffold372_size192401-processed-gene-0.5-mRNA-1 annotation:"hypothetical protein CAPTEDRAFT_160367"